jgi:hypothetical protein
VAERAEPILTKLASSERRIEWGGAALLFALLVQTGGIVWWGARIDTRVSAVEQKISATANAGETIARLDERTAAMNATIDRIDRRVSVAEERQAAREGYGR